jgi:hypothetical protein
MASRNTYPCFACRKAGYEIPVYLDGKDAEGRTKYLNEDGTKHVHKTNPLEKPSEESVQRGISAFTMMTDLTILVEPTQKLLVTVDGKLDRLLNLAELNKK